MIVWFFFLPRYMSISKDSSHPAVKYFSNDCFLQNEGFFFFFCLSTLSLELQALQKKLEMNEEFTGHGRCSWTGFQSEHHQCSIFKTIIFKNINSWWCWSIKFSELKIASEIKLQNYKIWTEAYGNDMLLFVDIIPWCFWSSPCSGIFW